MSDPRSTIKVKKEVHAEFIRLAEEKGMKLSPFLRLILKDHQKQEIFRGE